MPVVICVFGIIAITNIILAAKLWSLRRGVRELGESLSEILGSDTNNLITLSCRDRHARELASQINDQLKILRRQRHKYTQGDRELKNAVTNISHDLRTPLTAIGGYLELLRREDKSPQVKEYLDIISERTELLKQLTEELFRYSVILSAEEGAELSQVHINRVLAESITGYYAALTERGIEPEIDICEERIMRQANEEMLSRVFSNLISNALKYSAGDLSVKLSRDGVVTFANSAPDLTAVEAERLFDRFYTVETARGSTGLGLAIARTLISAMGGRIEAEVKGGQLVIRLTLAN
ncbi:MAG: HAMP domain-containing histidine kinase [Ruminococcus sp.]|nr:HAMP domain-containing histidine kinase [Ruminococcus sp.]